MTHTQTVNSTTTITTSGGSTSSSSSSSSSATATGAEAAGGASTDAPLVPGSNGCYQDGKYIADGETIDTEDPCEHCYCMGGDMICAIDPCMGPLEGETDNCVALPPPEGECCTKEYVCSKYFLSVW